MSFPRRRESRKINGFWIPAFAGMTALGALKMREGELLPESVGFGG